MFFDDDDDQWLIVIVGSTTDGIILKMWPSLLGMSHRNSFIEAGEDLIGSRYCICEGVGVLMLFFDNDDPWPMVIVGGTADDILLKLWPSLLFMSHGNAFVEAVEDMLCSR